MSANEGGVEIAGSGSGYYGAMDSADYAGKINTPAQNPEYFDRFHRPMIERAKERNDGASITLLDIACGPAFELEFVADDPDTIIVATDISTSEKVLGEVRERLGTRALLFAADVVDSPVRSETMDAGMIVNAMVYVPDKMLAAMASALKPGGEMVANFRNYSNPFNRPFYRHYRERGGVILDGMVGTYPVKVLDYAECVDDNGDPDEQIRGLGQQAYFTMTDDIINLVKDSGLRIVDHRPFSFSSPVNDNNQVEVYTLQEVD